MKKDKIVAGLIVTGSLIGSSTESIEAFSLSDFFNNNEEENNIIKQMFSKSSKSSRSTAYKEEVDGSVLTITLGEEDSIPSMIDNPNAYTEIKVITVGDKALTVKDFKNLNRSLIPIIDLSEAKAENIPDRAFKDNTALTTFKFPKEVLVISGEAFSGCTNLAGTLTIPDTVTTIETLAYSNCRKLTGNLDIPDSVTYIGASAFNNCSGFNGNLKLSRNITIINENTFSGCGNFTGNLEIPELVTEIKSGAFRSCSRFEGDVTIPDSVMILGDGVFSNCTGFDGNLNIGQNLQVIGSSAFNGCTGLNGSLVIPNSVVEIGASAFAGCSGFNRDLTLSNSLVKIGNSAFYKCTSLRGRLSIPSSVTYIGDNAFEECNKFTGDLTIPNSVNYLGARAFYRCTGFNGELSLSTSITSIKNHTFYGCDMLSGSIIIPNGVTSIGEGAFFDCNGFEGNLVIPETVTTIGKESFYRCLELKGNLTIPNKVTNIGDKAFYGCIGFDGQLSLGKSIQVIGNSAFGECRNITGNLTIPSTTKTIGPQAFINCAGLTGKVSIPRTVQQIGTVAFIGIDNIDLIISVDDTFRNSNYREEMLLGLIDYLPPEKLFIEVPYEFNISNTWLKDIDVAYIKKPVLTQLDGYVLLSIPTPCSEENISVFKDGEESTLPKINKSLEYKFKSVGSYDVNLITDLGTESNITFTVDTPIKNSNIIYENGMLTISDSNKQNIRFEYRINGGEWKEYTDTFMLECENKIVNLEVKVIIDEDLDNAYVLESRIELLTPTINASDRTIKIGSEFNELEGVSAIDIDGSEIAIERIEVIESNVNKNVPGDYKIKYKVAGKNKCVFEKLINVKVIGPVITANDKTIYIDDEFAELDGVTAVDSLGNDITKDITVVENKVNNKIEGVYPVIYSVVENDITVTKTIFVTVAKKEATDTENPGDNSNTDNPNGGDAGNKNELDVTVTFNNVLINLNSNFNPLDGIRIIDENGEDITSKVTINVLYNNVDTSKAGVYKVAYEFEYLGQKDTKEIEVTVQDNGQNNNQNNNTNNNQNSNQNNNSSDSTEKPQTSDVNLDIYGGITIISTAGLFVLNRKKDENK